MPGLFITGTSTEVGKTYVAALIARTLVERGVRVGVYKPVASGCRAVDGELVSDDAVALWEAAGRPGSLEQACPQRFAAPLAPHLAARLEGRAIDEGLLRGGLDFWRAESDLVLVEGAGGLMSPLADTLYNADLAGDFELPLIVVAANALGTINQTLQTLLVARGRRPPLDVAGVVLNQAVAPQGDASTASNADELRSRCDAPLLACVAWRGEALEGDARESGAGETIDWAALAAG